MFRLCIPIMMNTVRSDEDVRMLAEQLRACDTDTVFLVFDRVLASHRMLTEKINAFCRTRERLMAHGLTVNAWLAPTIGYGGKSSCDNDAPEQYTRIVSDRGRVTDGAFCPLDEDFTADFLSTVTALAQTGVEEIMFEDDYTLTGGKMFGEHGCCCEKHMALLQNRLGESISREFLSEQLYAPNGLRYRQIFLDVMGETLADFTKKVEKNIHAVNPKIRIGLSTNASSYRMEGVSPNTLAKLIAGKTRPFIRMTGAPYWDQLPTLAPNIDAIRLQAHWLLQSGAELISEGDVYPRPRHFIPASYLEMYDMILRADGCCDGILKYMTDYTSKPNYETGYLDRHIRNKPHYEEIARRFADKETVGLNIIEHPDTFRNASFGDDLTRETYHAYGGFLPLISQWFTADNSLPTAYEKNDCASLAFGENARFLDSKTLKNGVILDMQAAKILMEQGIDLGIRTYRKTDPMPVEYFCFADDYTIATANPSAIYYDLTLAPEAQILSRFLKIPGAFGDYKEHLWPTAETCPACYFYQNNQGEKFLVFAFSAETSWAKGVWQKGLFRSYYRQEELMRGIELLQGRKLPAICPKNPDLYILCKKDETSMSIGLWNLFADSVLNPEIILDQPYSRADFYHCNGTLKEDRIRLSEELPPYSFAFVTVSR